MAVAPLIDLLADDHVQVRWEAAKALGKIGGLEAAEALVTCLYDEDRDVRWMATEGLIEMGSAAVTPLLRILVSGFNSIWVREGALHVLRALSETDVKDAVMPVIITLEDSTSAFSVPVAAHDALEILRKERRLRIIRSVLHDYR